MNRLPCVRLCIAAAVGSVLAVARSAVAAQLPEHDQQASGTLAGAAAIEVPLDLYQDRYAFVRGTLNDTATDIVVDSGAGITVVDRQLADQLGLQGGIAVQAKGVGGESRSVQLSKGTLRLAGLELRDLSVAILDLTEVHERLGRRMPVILGKELFHAFTVTFDYPERRLRVCPPDKFVAPQGVEVCPTRRLDDGHVMIELEFEDLGRGWFTVDTGSGDTLELHAPYVDEHALLTRYDRLGDRLIAGVGGSLPAKTATAKRLSIAGQEFYDVPVTLAIEHKGVLASTKAAGNLGAELLKRFVVTFDYARDRLVFAKGPALDTPFPKDRSGLVLDRRGEKVIVATVSPNSPAAAAGFKGGEILVGVDGEAFTKTNTADVLRRVLRQPAGTVVRLRIADASERNIELADYF